MKYFVVNKKRLTAALISVLVIILLGFVLYMRLKTFPFQTTTNENKSETRPTASKTGINENITTGRNEANPEIDKSSKTTQRVKKEFFLEYRLERNRGRDRHIELLNEIINNANSSDEARKEAQKRILNISRVQEKELELENLIKARGYKDAVAIIQDRGLTVIVKMPSLTAEDIAKITDAAEQCTGTDRAKIIVLART